ncbi:hypothetical protein J4223_01700 [Candidatus Woesearchaeota archaeon]|nr:hypothetical protein [Candidatus Woesearchaeota archaeon]
MGILTEESLIKSLVSDIHKSKRKQVLFLAGHFPIIYTPEAAIEAINQWGPFSPYTLELACKVGERVKNNKTIKFMFVVDDHTYEEISQLSSYSLSKLRRDLYRKRSGSSAELVPEFHTIMESHGFTEANVIRQNQKKKGREDCLYFSEKILRTQRPDISNQCAREYHAIFEDPEFDKDSTYLIGFIPRRCEDNICRAALDEIDGLTSSHVFLETAALNETGKELLNLGATYTKY